MTANASSPVLISLVVPVHNEEDTIAPFLERTQPIIEEIVEPFGDPVIYEIVFVDDGSTDDTLARLRTRAKADPRIRVVSLSRNFGKDVALTAGLRFASGKAVVPIDVDLQDPPEVIPLLVEKWLQGFDVVYATRADRSSDDTVKRATARGFYKLFNKIADRPIPPDAGDFRLLSRDVVDVLNRFPERARFMKGLFAWVGFRQCSVPYARVERAAGTTKWGYWRLWNFAIDGITSSTTMPLRVWSYLGGLTAIAAFLYAAFLVTRTLILGIDVPGYASLMVLVLFFGGINLLSLGIIGEYLGRTYTEVKGRPLYIVRETYGLDAALRGEDPWIEPSIGEWPSRKTATGGSPVVARSSHG
ncbi:glycosyltransferase family 2 protein [Afifella sp. IM 167]|uniref:glycosyltransferase family 2 protein n=1 Tax=Afifella sp. IM 167 TaxID=2033586 RepID=UPI001CCCC5F8|nr:glycosyltransferase family 2 protein [Afifella sp. IM 167]MBZ8131685.1 glycosyltransferase [Afifella sp. IM 167]